LVTDLKMPIKKLFLFTLIALLAFAANSILCRLALKVERIDPLDFSIIRILSAAIILWLLLVFKNAHSRKIFMQYGTIKGAASLLIYVLGFSYAYVGLSTATGALILFAAVQFTMLGAALLGGKRLSILESVGIIMSLLGLCYFVYPELDKPNGINFIFMFVAGIAWGIYSLIGSQSVSPLLDTSSNFIRLVPLCILALFIAYFLGDTHITSLGLVYSVASGALASGLGYSLWYLVLPNLDKSVAAVSQLSVPIWAALGGILFIHEGITWHLMISSCFILGGILLVILSQVKLKKTVV
jgi:drug/metabolite transporter (DMT)-like permease